MATANEAAVVDLAEAKAGLDALLDRVSAGESIVIARDGRPTALLSPATETDRRDRRRAIEAFKLFAKGRSLAGMTIREMIEEGRS